MSPDDAAAAPRNEIVLVRHGETEWSRSGRHTGRTDVPLTERGREQAVALAQALSGRTFEVVLTSPLRRAADTARLAGFGAEAQTRDELREWDYGAYEGRTTADIREERPVVALARRRSRRRERGRGRRPRRSRDRRASLARR